MPEPSAVIHVGDTVRGTLAKSLPECSFSTVDGGWGGLCQTFEITLPASGVLTATVRWTADAPLELFFKTSSGERIDMQCCGVPLSFRASVEQGVTYRIEIAYGGRPAGYPNIPPVDYTLDTSLTAGEVTALGSVRAILLGDETRTQRISGARIELTDGPQAGRTAGFDPSTGIYEISGVPMGFVGIRASADGFVPLSSRIAVGTNVATEFVLERLVPLSDASYSLGGLIYAYPSTPGDSSFSAWGDVKVEVVDGPLAGVFTVSDCLGLYVLKGLPPGVIHVRASADWLESQTLEVAIPGDGRLNFVMKRR